MNIISEENINIGGLSGKAFYVTDHPEPDAYHGVLIGQAGEVSHIITYDPRPEQIELVKQMEKEGLEAGVMGKLPSGTPILLEKIQGFSKAPSLQEFITAWVRFDKAESHQELVHMGQKRDERIANELEERIGKDTTELFKVAEIHAQTGEDSPQNALNRAIAGSRVLAERATVKADNEKFRSLLTGPLSDAQDLHGTFSLLPNELLHTLSTYEKNLRTAYSSNDPRGTPGFK